MTEDYYCQRHPNAKRIASRLLHPGLPGRFMKVYLDRAFDGHYYYSFCFDETVILNAIKLPIRILEQEEKLFCHEWFREWEQVTNIKESMEDEESWGFPCPSHRNEWVFSRRWLRRYTERADEIGEVLRAHKQKQLLEYVSTLMDTGTKKQKEELQKQMEAILYANLC
jgi:hypothetical protein